MLAGNIFSACVFATLWRDLISFLSSRLLRECICKYFSFYFMCDSLLCLCGGACVCRHVCVYLCEFSYVYIRFLCLLIHQYLCLRLNVFIYLPMSSLNVHYILITYIFTKKYLHSILNINFLNIIYQWYNLIFLNLGNVDVNFMKNEDVLS